MTQWLELCAVGGDLHGFFESTIEMIDVNASDIQVSIHRFYMDTPS
jgi:hypothetical protein